MLYLRLLAPLSLLLTLCPIHAYALGPVDGEVGIGALYADLDPDDISGNVDADTLFIYGEGSVGEHWGIRAAWYDSDVESDALSDQRRLQIELRRKLIAPTDNTFLALGAGFENTELVNGSDSNGLRLSAEGRIGLGFVYFFGRVGWVPFMEDAGNFDDITATEIDLGIHITPLPFLSIRLGYLEYELDYDNSGLVGGSGSNTSGYYIAGGFHW